MPDLERVTLAIDADLLARFDALLATRGLGNRSEAMRDLIRARLVEDETRSGVGDAVASLTLLYDHAQRELSEKLVEAGHHGSGAEVLASMHVHLDARLCLEVLTLRGRPADLESFADSILGLKGVLHGKLVVSAPEIVAGSAGTRHRHAPPHAHPHPHAHGHSHAHPHAVSPSGRRPRRGAPRHRRQEKPR